MKIFIASIDPEELVPAKDFGAYGIITNPTIVAAVKKPWRQSVREAAQILQDGPFHLQLTKEDNRSDALKQVNEFYEVLGDRLVIKACIHQETLSLIPVIHKMGLAVNITGIVSLAQAYIAIQAGADYVSIYLGRAENAGIDSLDIIRKARRFIVQEDFDCQIVAASIKGVSHFVQATEAGADYAACPFELLPQMIHHDATDTSMVGFRKDWESIPEK